MARGRPATPLGTWGEISVQELPTGKFQANTYLRQHDGKVKRVRARGGSKTAAITALKRRCVEQLETRDTKALATSSPFSEVLDYWLSKKTGVTDQSRERYTNSIELHIKPALGSVRLNELNPQLLDTFVNALSPGVVGGVRTALTGSIRLALKYELIRSNPLDAVEFPSPKQKQVRTLDAGQIVKFRQNIARSKNDLLIDVIDFCFRTGVRVGEVLAIRWEDLELVDEGRYRVHICGTVVTNKVHGTFRQPFGKTSTSKRFIQLSPRAAEIIERRREQFGVLEMVFPSETGTYKDVSNFGRPLREYRGDDFKWVTVHTIRKTVASLVADEMGPHKAADLLGHVDSGLTERVYYERTRSGVPIGDFIDKAVGV